AHRARPRVLPSGRLGAAARRAHRPARRAQRGRDRRGNRRTGRGPHRRDRRPPSRDDRTGRPRSPHRRRADRRRHRPRRPDRGNVVTQTHTAPPSAPRLLPARGLLPGRRLAPAVAAGAAAELAGLGLTAASAWLITRAAEQPPLAALSVAIVAVRAFAVGKGVFRYGERLAGHDVALRAQAATRERLYESL